MMKLKNFILASLLALFVSCNTTTPENYFDRTTLAVNTIGVFGGRDFDKMKSDKAQNRLQIMEDGKVGTTKSVAEHIEKLKLATLQLNIDKIKDLKSTDDTKDMIAASLDLFNYVKEVYSTDYMAIAKMIDEDKPEAEVQAAINALDEKVAPVFDEKYDKLLEYALPYAKDNNIPVQGF